jgi:protein-S-isoprenylcysteine O-methyltransferase Ste14
MTDAIKTVVYMEVMHGFLTFYFPLQLAVRDTAFFHSGILRYPAVLFWVLGTAIIVQCSVDLIRRGGGTPAHFDPPKQLVLSGIYRHVRNPIYLGAVIVQIGYILWFGSVAAILYTLLYILAFHILIIFIEEPILKNSFGSAYEEYQKRVPRWVPKIK